MVKPVAILGHAVLGIGRLMCRGHDPVLQREVLELERLKEGIVGSHLLTISWQMLQLADAVMGAVEA
jgi:hypothetical protein